MMHDSHYSTREMTFSLLQLSKPELEALAASQAPVDLATRAISGSMPPHFVATRALEYAAAGYPLPWSTTFLIVKDADSRIIGGCGFKNVPENGRVEIGYNVAPAAQGQGAATHAVLLLVQKAFEAGVTQVVAEIAPTNQASIRVAQKAGFKQFGTRVDERNEHVLQWAVCREV